MSNPNAIPVGRTEDFFRLCNGHRARAQYLRSFERISGALGVLGVSLGKVREIIAVVDNIVLRDGVLNLRVREGQQWRTNTVTEVSNQYPEVFDRTCNGPEEEKFVRERGIHAMIRYAINRANKAARLARNAGMAVADGEAADDTEEEEEPDEGGGQSRGNNNDLANSDEEKIESATSSPAKEAASSPSTSTGLQSVVVEVWSTQYARSLATFELKDIATETARLPNYDLLNNEVRRVLPPNANPPFILPGKLEFVHVLHDGTNTGIISQEVLQMEWDDWRKGTKGKTFHLWVRDCPTDAANEKSQPPTKYGAWGWEYHPLLNGPIRFLRLPLH